MRLQTLLVPLSLLLLLAQSAAALQADADARRAQIDAFLSHSYPADQPGAAVIVTVDGDVLFRDAYGMADLELGVPLEPDMVFRLGSITKQFTGAAIAMLEQEGKLTVDDPITKFLPDYPTHGHDITVAHLLAHTSGIRSYTGMPGWMQTKIKSDLSVDELIDGFKNEPMDFAPGERYRYNNSGYVLLGAIVEKVSGQSYEQYLQKHIFDPLEMKSSYYGEHGKIVPRRTPGYDGGPGTYKNGQYLSMTQPYAAGSLLSTVDDLASWDRSLYLDELLDEQARRKMVTPFNLNDGSSTNYGYGFSIGELRGRPSVSHGGGIFGFSTFGLRLPEERVYVAVLTNSTGHPVRPGFVAQKVAAIAIGDPFPEFEATKVSPDVLERYTGVYRIDDETTRAVTLVDGRLYTQRSGGPRQPVTPASDKEFFYEGSFTHLEFVTDAAGDVSHMLVYQDGAKTPERADLTDEPLPERAVADIDPDLYDDYAGTYELRPGFELEIVREGDRLFGQPTGQPRVELFPASETEFFLEVVDAQLTFERGADGRATHVVLEQGGNELRGQRID